jgi:hypothetical protein
MPFLKACNYYEDADSCIAVAVPLPAVSDRYFGRNPRRKDVFECEYTIIYLLILFLCGMLLSYTVIYSCVVCFYPILSSILVWYATILYCHLFLCGMLLSDSEQSSSVCRSDHQSSHINAYVYLNLRVLHVYVNLRARDTAACASCVRKLTST